jgi:hypothetical protein
MAGVTKAGVTDQAWRMIMTITSAVGTASTERKKNFFRKQRQQIEERLDYWLDVALEDSFPCSDPISSMRSD